MGTKRNQLDSTFDAALQLKDAGAVTATGAGQVGGVNRSVNLGAAIVQGVFVVDIAALDVAGLDETYDIRLQVSSDPTFATDVTIAARVQSGPVATTGQDSAGVGRQSRPFINIGEDGAPKAYARVYHSIGAGAATASINYSAFISQNPLP
jgi:hypothetical protein